MFATYLTNLLIFIFARVRSLFSSLSKYSDLPFSVLALIELPTRDTDRIFRRHVMCYGQPNSLERPRRESYTIIIPGQFSLSRTQREFYRNGSLLIDSSF